MSQISSSHGSEMRWTEELPDVPEKDVRLKDYGQLFQDTPTRFRFYPRKLLKHIFTEKVLLHEIQVLEGLDGPKRNKLVKDILGSGSSDTRTYIAVFATLKVIGELKMLQGLVDAQISDQELPLKLADDSSFCGNSKKPLPDDLQRWIQRSMFEEQQYNMVIPFFGNQPEPFDFSWTHVLPYSTIAQNQNLNQSEEPDGPVSKIEIHPYCHDFRSASDGLQDADEAMFYALKKVPENETVSFKREVEMLQRFNNTKHPHIVKLLASFKSQKGNFLIFPWATNDLGVYWKKVRPRPDASDPKLVQWISCQARMLVEAIKRIHDIPQDSEDDEHEYGRHSDLKPENILWYKSGGFGKLVIADLGLSKVHRYATKSYTIQKKVSVTPRYRPPEAVYKGGRMGRIFDIWALGGMFLEMLSWLHGGYTKLVEFRDTRLLTPSIRGPDTDEYYEWVRVQDAGFYTIRVKEAVTKWIHELRGECSQFTYDFLNIVEDQMLVVERDERASAKDLLMQMENLDIKCQEEDYCVRRKIHENHYAPKPKLKKREFNEDLRLYGIEGVPVVVSHSFR